MVIQFETEWLGTVDPIPLIAGLLFLFVGWLLYWLSLNAAGGIIAGGLGLVVAEAFREYFEIQEPWGLVLRVGAVVLGAVIGIAVARFLHRTAFFVAGCAVGAAAWYYVMLKLRSEGIADWAQNDGLFAFGIPIAGIIVGIFSVVANRLVIALATAIVGAILVMIGITWHWGVWPLAPLALVGFVFQVSMSRKKKKKKRRIEEE